MNGKYNFGCVNSIHEHFYVGRDDAFASLQDALERGASAFVYGAPRVGKSAFACEFKRRFEKQRKGKILYLSFKGGDCVFLHDEHGPTLAEQLKKNLGYSGSRRKERGRIVIIDELNSGIDLNGGWEKSQQLDFVNALYQLMCSGFQFVLISQLSPMLFLHRTPYLRTVFPSPEWFAPVHIRPFTMEETRKFCSHSAAPAEHLSKAIFEFTKGNALMAGIVLYGVNLLCANNERQTSIEEVLRHGPTAERIERLRFGQRRFVQEWDTFGDLPEEIEKEVLAFFSDLGLVRKRQATIDLNGQQLEISERTHSFQGSVLQFLLLVFSLTAPSAGYRNCELRKRINDICGISEKPRWSILNGYNGHEILDSEVRSAAQQLRNNLEGDHGFLSECGIADCRIVNRGANKKEHEKAIPPNWRDFLSLRWRYGDQEFEAFPAEELKSRYPRFSEVFLHG